MGSPLGDGGVKLLASALAAKLDAPIGVRDVAYPPQARRAEKSAPGPWIPSLRAALDASRDRALFACVELPSSFRPDAGATGSTSAEIESLLAGARTDRLVVRREAKEWSVLLSTSPCADAADGGADAAQGAPYAATSGSTLGGSGDAAVGQDADSASDAVQ